MTTIEAAATAAVASCCCCCSRCSWIHEHETTTSFSECFFSTHEFAQVNNTQTHIHSDRTSSTSTYRKSTSFESISSNLRSAHTRTTHTRSSLARLFSLSVPFSCAPFFVCFFDEIRRLSLFHRILLVLFQPCCFVLSLLFVRWLICCCWWCYFYYNYIVARFFCFAVFFSKALSFDFGV